jgi:hypothetical protein
VQLMVQYKKHPLLWTCTDPNAARHEQRKPCLRRSSTSLWVPHYFHADPRYLTHTHYPVHPQVDCSLFPRIPGTTQHGVRPWAHKMNLHIRGRRSYSTTDITDSQTKSKRYPKFLSKTNVKREFSIQDRKGTCWLTQRLRKKLSFSDGGWDGTVT